MTEPAGRKASENFLAFHSKPPRCEVCDWPLAPSIEQGCVEGNCSYRPHEGTAEFYRIEEIRRRLANAKEPQL